MTHTYIACPGYVLVRRLKNESKSKIILTDEQPCNFATVMDVGDPIRLQDGNMIIPPVSIGETVYLPHFGGDKLEDGTDEDLYLMKFQSIMCTRKER